ncbi:MAG: hypothetical protein GX207_11910 [Peptococcaceae bacterium]|nr:hypothetical protein [Peptococcaceae bacterium]
MILIIGGNSQGKLQFAQEMLQVGNEMISDGGTCQLDQAFAKPVLNRLHLLISRLKQQGLDPYSFIKQGIENNPEITIICDELGLGVVPIDREERELQELTGRLLCDIARQAAQVYRVHCSIPVKIKG